MQNLQNKYRKDIAILKYSFSYIADSSTFSLFNYSHVYMFFTVSSLLFNLSPSHADITPVFYFSLGTVLCYPAVTEIFLFPNTFRALCIVGMFGGFVSFLNVVIRNPEYSLSFLGNAYENLQSSLGWIHPKQWKNCLFPHSGMENPTNIAKVTTFSAAICL